MHVERRRAPRVEVLGRLHGHVVSIDAPVTVREVSLGGLSFSSALNLPIGAVHEFRLTLGDDSSVLLRGRIVRSELRRSDDGSSVYVTGVQFVEEEAAEDAGSIGNLIDRMG
jgi:hypothetical protein